MRKANFQPLILTLLTLLVVSLPVSRAADKPLTADDVTLLLIGGASSQKMVDLIKQRGIGFKMTAELATGFRRDGADDSVIQALEGASGQGSSQTQAPGSTTQPSSQPSLKRPTLNRSSPSANAASGSAPAAPSGSAPAASSPAPAARVGADGVSPSVTAGPGPGPAPVTSAADGQTQQTAPSSASSGSSSGPVLIRHAPVVSAPAPVQSAPANPSSGAGSASASASIPRAKPAGRPDLGEPSAAEVQRIIQAFAAKEMLFKQARDNYTYHQINKVQEVGPDGEVTGQFQQDWDILYDDNGTRIERVTYAPLDSLKSLILTQQDYDAFRSIQPFVMTTAELPEYDVQYKGHVQVDEVTAYVFSLRPKAIEKGRQYFQGMVWVDDRDLQIVKSEGKQVPEIKMKHGEENLFPRFTTWREQIDGKFWFPTFTLADDTLYFQGGPVHMKEIIRYTDYKQFKSTHKITNVASVPGGTGQQQPQNQKIPPKQ